MKMTTDEQVALARKVAEGDERALEKLMEQIRPVAYSVCLKILPESEVEDVLQEVAIKLPNYLSCFDPQKGTLNTWIMNFVHRRAVDAWRKRTKYFQRNEQFGTEYYQRQEQGGVELGDEGCQRLRELIDVLPHNNATVIRSAWLGDVPYNEVARILGLPEGTCKARLFRGKKKLRTEILKDPQMREYVVNMYPGLHFA